MAHARSFENDLGLGFIAAAAVERFAHNIFSLAADNSRG